MKKLLAIAMLLTLSANAFALNKASIEGTDALDIVVALKKAGIAAASYYGGEDDAGNSRVTDYNLFGMECQTAYIKFGREFAGVCDFHKVATQNDLNLIKAILTKAGLNPSNAIYK